MVSPKAELRVGSVCEADPLDEHRSMSDLPVGGNSGTVSGSMQFGRRSKLAHLFESSIH